MRSRSRCHERRTRRRGPDQTKTAPTIRRAADAGAERPSRTVERPRKRPRTLRAPSSPRPAAASAATNPPSTSRGIPRERAGTGDFGRCPKKPPSNHATGSTNIARRRRFAPRNPASTASASTGTRSSGLSQKVQQPSYTGPIPVSFRCASTVLHTPVKRQVRERACTQPADGMRLHAIARQRKKMPQPRPRRPRHAAILPPGQRWMLPIAMPTACKHPVAMTKPRL